MDEVKQLFAPKRRSYLRAAVVSYFTRDRSGSGELFTPPEKKQRRYVKAQLAILVYLIRQQYLV